MIILTLLAAALILGIIFFLVATGSGDKAGAAKRTAAVAHPAHPRAGGSN